MGSKAGSIEALLVRHVALHGVDTGDWLELEIGDQQTLADLLNVDYANMTRRIRMSELLELEGTLLRLKKEGSIQDGAQDEV